jgi:hypothetical protein
MHRYVPQDLEFQNERQRLGTWLVASHPLTKTLSLHFGWAHAFRTPGDPGQHNDSFISLPAAFLEPMPPRALRPTIAPTCSLSRSSASSPRDWASMPIGRSPTMAPLLITISALADGPSQPIAMMPLTRQVDWWSNPHCWTGGKLMGFSLGMNWKL